MCAQQFLFALVRDSVVGVVEREKAFVYTHQSCLQNLVEIIVQPIN